MLQAAHNTLVRADVPPDMMTRSHMESLRNRDINTIKQLGVKYILVLLLFLFLFILFILYKFPPFFLLFFWIFF